MWPASQRRNYGYYIPKRGTLTPLTVILDGITPLGPNQLLRGIPAVGTPQSLAVVCRKRASLWATRELHRVGP